MQDKKDAEMHTRQREEKKLRKQQNEVRVFIPSVRSHHWVSALHTPNRLHRLLEVEEKGELFGT